MELPVLTDTDEAVYLEDDEGSSEEWAGEPSEPVNPHSDLGDIKRTLQLLMQCPLHAASIRRFESLFTKN